MGKLEFWKKRKEWEKEVSENLRSGREQAERWNNMDVWWTKMPYGEEEGEEEYED